MLISRISLVLNSKVRTELLKRAIGIKKNESLKYFLVKRVIGNLALFSTSDLNLKAAMFLL